MGGGEGDLRIVAFTMVAFEVVCHEAVVLTWRL